MLFQNYWPNAVRTTEAAGLTNTGIDPTTNSHWLPEKAVWLVGKLVQWGLQVDRGQFRGAPIPGADGLILGIVAIIVDTVPANLSEADLLALLINTTVTVIIKTIANLDGAVLAFALEAGLTLRTICVRSAVSFDAIIRTIAFVLFPIYLALVVTALGANKHALVCLAVAIRGLYKGNRVKRRATFIRGIEVANISTQKAGHYFWCATYLHGTTAGPVNLPILWGAHHIEALPAHFTAIWGRDAAVLFTITPVLLPLAKAISAIEANHPRLIAVTTVLPGWAVFASKASGHLTPLLTALPFTGGEILTKGSTILVAAWRVWHLKTFALATLGDALNVDAGVAARATLLQSSRLAFTVDIANVTLGAFVPIFAIGSLVWLAGTLTVNAPDGEAHLFVPGGTVTIVYAVGFWHIGIITIVCSRKIGDSHVCAHILALLDGLELFGSVYTETTGCQKSGHCEHQNEIEKY